MNSLQKRLLALMLAIILTPLFLGRRRIIRRVFIAAPPTLIFPYLNDLRKWPRWRSWNRGGDGPHFSYAGPPAGVGATQIFETSSGGGVLRILASRPSDHLAYRTEMQDGTGPITGTLVLREMKRGTWVQWVVKWPAHPNPFLRWVDLWQHIRRGRKMGHDLSSLRELAEAELAEGERTDR